MKEIRVLIVDDHTLFREGLISILSSEKDIKVVGAVSSGVEALKLASSLKPDITLLDIKMPVMDGIDTLFELRKKGIDTKVIMLLEELDDDFKLNGLRLGAAGFISKQVEGKTLIKALRSVHEGEIWMERQLAVKKLQEFLMHQDNKRSSLMPTKSLLTKREAEVLKHLATGLRNKEIAEKLFISEKTVKSHMNAIFRKLGVGDRLQAALYAVKFNLLET